ncbi:MAG: prolipoprotein diacylglyceryl transferase [Oscillospiraceae bacterium]|nr:prolipoprotein diacylglyceryl transferase [Oscillospiraceae bacterium]
MNNITFPKLGLEFTINETAFSIGGFEIKWYALIIMTGLLLAIVFGYRNARKFGLDMELLYEPILYATFAAIIGARLYYCIFNFSQFKDDPISMLYIWNGGIAIYGAVIGAVLAGLIICKIKKLPFLACFDMVVMGFLIGQGIGRWGNFVNAEAYGGNTSLPWGMSGDSIQKELYILSLEGMKVNPTEPVHPTFLYESLWCLLGFLLLRLFLKHRRYDGQIILMYMTWYGFGRMFIEGLRTDSLMIGTLRVSQVLSAVIFLFGLITLIVMQIKIKSKHDDEYLKLFAKTEASAELIKKAEAIREAEKSKKKKEEKTEETEENVD